MTASRCRSATLVALLVAVLVASTSSVSTPAVAQSQDASRTLANKDALFIDGRTFQIVTGTAKTAMPDPVQSLNARYLGPAAIVFRADGKLYIVNAPLPLESGAAELEHMTAAAEPGQIRIEYVPPTNPAHQKVYDMIRRRHSLEMVQKIFSPFRLPVDLLIRTVGCDGVSNAWYQRVGNRPTVSLCYEYLQEIWQSMPEKDAPSEGLTMADAVCGQLFFAVAHELGHAMFDIFDVPIFGRQEDAADQFATFIMLQFGGGVAYRLVEGAAYGYHGYIKNLRQMPTVTLPLAAFSSDHGSPEERYFNLICTAYGYDPTLFADEMSRIPESRAKKCKFEYSDLKFAFDDVFKSHIDDEKVKTVLATKWFVDLTE